MGKSEGYGLRVTLVEGFVTDFRYRLFQIAENGKETILVRQVGMPDLKVVSSQFQSNVSALISSSIVQGILEQSNC